MPQNRVQVTIYNVDVHGTMSVRAKGQMDVDPNCTCAEALGCLTGFLDEMHATHLPNDDRRFLVVSGVFLGFGELAVTGTGEEVGFEEDRQQA